MAKNNTWGMIAIACFTIWFWITFWQQVLSEGWALLVYLGVGK